MTTETDFAKKITKRLDESAESLSPDILARLAYARTTAVSTMQVPVKQTTFFKFKKKIVQLFPTVKLPIKGVLILSSAAAVGLPLLLSTGVFDEAISSDTSYFTKYYQNMDDAIPWDHIKGDFNE